MSVTRFNDLWPTLTYGGNGQVFSNWIQFRITLHYLSIMSQDQTLVMYSGHPFGLFPSSRDAPRCVITNGLMIPRWSTTEQYQKSFALGVSMYGQMTAGSWCYIGPQGQGSKSENSFCSDFAGISLQSEIPIFFLSEFEPCSGHRSRHYTHLAQRRPTQIRQLRSRRQSFRHFWTGRNERRAGKGGNHLRMCRNHCRKRPEPGILNNI